MDEVVVVKLLPDGSERWRYTGKVLERTAAHVIIEAFFTHEDLPFHEIVLARGDRFIESYFSDRWYNIFEIHDKNDDHLKGWYCNVTMPARFEDSRISYVDLALDLLVYADGRQLALDQDEFEDLGLAPEDRIQALSALKELQTLFFQKFLDQNPSQPPAKE